MYMLFRHHCSSKARPWKRNEFVFECFIVFSRFQMFSDLSDQHFLVPNSTPRCWRQIREGGHFTGSLCRSDLGWEGRDLADSLHNGAFLEAKRHALKHNCKSYLQLRWESSFLNLTDQVNNIEQPIGWWSFSPALVSPCASNWLCSVKAKSVSLSLCLRCR